MTSPRCNSVDYRKRFNRSRSSSWDSTNSGGKASPNKPQLWHGEFTVDILQNLHSMSGSSQDPALALVYVYGGWNAEKNTQRLQVRMQEWLHPAVDGLECLYYCGKLCLTEDSVDELEQLPPSELPALAIVSQKGNATKSVVQYLPIKPASLQEALMVNSSSSSLAVVSQTIQGTLRQIESDLELNVAFEKAQAAVRIFVAGDRSSVGKSSVCLYVFRTSVLLLGLLRKIYHPAVRMRL